MLNVPDLQLLSRCVIQFRFQVRNELNLPVLAVIESVLTDPAPSDGDALRLALLQIPGIDEKEWCLFPMGHRFQERNLLRDAAVVNVLLAFCREMTRLLRAEEYDRAHALADTFHNLPRELAEGDLSIPAYFWQEEVAYYRKKWDANFLLAEEAALNGPCMSARCMPFAERRLHLDGMIPQRRSVRSFSPRPVDAQTLEDIHALMDSARPLMPEAAFAWRIIPASDANFLQKWGVEHVLAIFAGEGEAALVNAGFLGQQADLFMQMLGLGTCWVGLGWLKDGVEVPDGMRLAALMPFGWPGDVPLRSGPEAFKRKPLSEIADIPDERLEPARFAPSAVNSQPWRFIHGDGVIHVYREALGPIKQRTLGKFNPIDVGIALAHLYVTHRETFTFACAAVPPEREGLVYVGTITL